MSIHVNGYIIQRYNDSFYKGIEGDNWYLNYESQDIFFETYYNAHIDKAWMESSYVDCCSDEYYIERYIRESKKLGIEYRILLCMTCKKNPNLIKPFHARTIKILGYDYAYSGGSYYSSILNDIVSNRIKQFEQFNLNENALFDSYDKAKEFEKCRENLLALDKNHELENGEFIIYKLCEIKL